jgi:hypothetical protein
LFERIEAPAIETPAGAEIPEGARSAAGPNSTRVETGPNRTNADIISTENAAETASLSLTTFTFVRIRGPMDVAP